MNDTICWKTWNDSGDRIEKISKSHDIDPSNDRKTVCGMWIPDNQDGIEIENGDMGHGSCKKCKSKK
jgi:hypothetical protein